MRPGPSSGPGAPISFRSLLRNVNVVSAVRSDVPESHHGVVFVNYVVAVNWILAHPVAEAEEDLHTFVRVYLHNVLSRVLNGQGRRQSVTREDLVLLKMNMDWVRPISREVGQYPLVRAILRHGESEIVAIHKLTVNRPLSVQTIELERANDARLNVGAGELVERGFRPWIHATIVNSLGADIEL